VELIDLTWEAVKTPAGLGLLLAALMTFIVKPLIDMIHRLCYPLAQGDSPNIPVIINLVTFGLAMLIAMWRIGPATKDDWGVVFVLAVVSMFMSIAEYELVKNVAALRSVDVKGLSKRISRAVLPE
jgi:hypothetical protein